MVFDAPSISLSIFRQHLDLERPFHREIAFDIARGEYARQEHTMAEWQPDQVVTRALQTLHRLDGRLDAHGLAAGSNMPLRSTQREFGRAGLGFRSLLDQVRLAHALDPLLRAGKYGAARLTKMFGYSTKLAFARAKDRWTAKTRGK
ncbi:helix-turn-helix domain-containing protein [Burkholderia plantarii]|uniref:helix-turn-helix domain-containing protein n=1 Tax=Burkholderia plantarii TaxID=41899 RepID=UPI001F5B6718|nr:helix-turn-helix domain-containing protein [Burkholderia plantarii]